VFYFSDAALYVRSAAGSVGGDGRGSRSRISGRSIRSSRIMSSSSSSSSSYTGM